MGLISEGTSPTASHHIEHTEDFTDQREEKDGQPSVEGPVPSIPYHFPIVGVAKQSF
jgi:hypothetical protein